jgi:hypothetical protein
VEIVDIPTRIVTEKLAEIWHQPIVVEAKPPASGNLGPGFARRAKRICLPSASIRRSEEAHYRQRTRLNQRGRLSPLIGNM